MVRKTKIRFDFKHFYTNYLALFDNSNSFQTFSVNLRKSQENLKLHFLVHRKETIKPNSQLLSVEGNKCKVTLCLEPYS